MCYDTFGGEIAVDCTAAIMMTLQHIYMFVLSFKVFQSFSKQLEMR